jgi:TetR/AcrR family transcriptional regulator
MTTKWSSTNLPSRSEERVAKRDALIRQAALAFRSKGFHATSMEDIATALGVTKGALYRYVKNKQEILFECFVSSNRIGDSALEIARWHKGDGLSKLALFINYFVENYLEHNTAGGAMVDIDALFPDQRQEIIAGRDKIDKGLRALINEGVEDGSIRVRDAKLAVLTIMGAINWIPSWYSASGALRPAEIAENISEFFLRGMAAPHPAKKPKE